MSMKRGLLMKLQLGLLLLALLLPQATESQATPDSNGTVPAVTTVSTKATPKKPKSGADTLQWSVSMLVVSTSLFLHFYH